MTPQQVIDHFGSVAAAARALKIKGPSFYGWVSDGRIPIDRQCHIEVVTGGVLIADREELGMPARNGGEASSQPAEAA